MVSMEVVHFCLFFGAPLAGGTKKQAKDEQASMLTIQPEPASNFLLINLQMSLFHIYL
jgi:hypothetical protein